MFSYFSVRSCVPLLITSSPCSPLFFALCVVMHSKSLKLFLCFWAHVQFSTFIHSCSHTSNSRLSFTHVLKLPLCFWGNAQHCCICSHSCFRRIHVMMSMLCSSHLKSEIVSNVSHGSQCVHMCTQSMSTQPPFRWRCRHCNGITTLKVDTTMSNVGWKTMQ